jgi:hypothetical protein
VQADASAQFDAQIQRIFRLKSTQGRTLRAYRLCKGYRIAYLRPFGPSEVAAYLRREKPEISEVVLHAIQDTYNLIELSSRPMLLEMIVKTIDKLDSAKVGAVTIYDVFTSFWIMRDQ